MSALPGQTVESYKHTLESVLAMEPEHISAYSLIVEENTLMYYRVKKAQIKGINILPDEESERKMYYLTNNILRSMDIENTKYLIIANRGKNVSTT